MEADERESARDEGERASERDPAKETEVKAGQTLTGTEARVGQVRWRSGWVTRAAARPGNSLKQNPRVGRGEIRKISSEWEMTRLNPGVKFAHLNGTNIGSGRSGSLWDLMFRVAKISK